MGGSLDLRKFLWHEDEPLIRQSTDIPDPRPGEPTRVSAAQVRRARLAVARNAHDADDCRLLLEMLGLAPTSDDATAGGSG